MDNERYVRLIHSDSEIADISIDDICALVKITKPVWEQIREKSVGDAPGPSYVSQISLLGSVTLDVVLTRYSQWFVSSNPEGGSYLPYQWQVVVAEGDSILANFRYLNDLDVNPVKDLFNHVEKEYVRQQEILKQESPAARTRALIQEYIKRG